MIKWILLMPFVWLMDYFYGIINPDFREIYLSFEESLTKFLIEERERPREASNDMENN